MFRRTLTTWVTAGAILAFATAPLLAQDKGARPNPSGNSSGGSSGGGSGRTASGGGDSGSSSGSRSGSTADRSSSGSGAGSSLVPSGFNTEFAPARPERRAAPRDNAGQRPSNANRDSSGSNDQQRRVAPSGGTNATVSTGDASGSRRAVPPYARPREGRPVIGTAYERKPVTGGGYPYYNPYYRYTNYYPYYPYGYYYAGYGFGLGYFYDPFLWGYYSPYAYGYGAPYFYGGGYYGGGGGYGGGYSRENSKDIGGLRLKVRPINGQVYVDGYYVGEVDSFDGNFQKLQIEAGAHRVEIRADGFESVQFEVMITPGETVIYKGDMKRIQ